jgi:geranylgeranyl pyrophosphate synthase
LLRLLPAEDQSPAVLHRAMHHAMFPGGKRLRPVLALLAARVTGGDPEAALLPAAGLELLHTYSLVHDDLPCMDDDELRRGRETCHVAFGEANALLAGDALLTLAFEAVAQAGGEAVMLLARAAGSLGMVGGQVADLEAEGAGAASGDARVPDLAALEAIHDRKTGALIAASLEVGAIAGGSTAERGLLREFGRLLGRAFQIADDCLDETGSAEELGKRPGADLARDKLTYPALLGLESSRREAQRLAGAAAELAPGICKGLEGSGLDLGVKLLQDVASYAISRTT